MSFRFFFLIILAFLYVYLRLIFTLSARSDFYGYVHTAGELEFHERVDGLGCGAVDVDEALVARELELFARLLVDEGRAVDGEDPLVGGQRYGTAYHCAGALYRLHNLLGRLVDQIVIVRFEFDSDFLAHMFVMTILSAYDCSDPLAVEGRNICDFILAGRHGRCTL